MLYKLSRNIILRIEYRPPFLLTPLGDLQFNSAHYKHKWFLPKGESQLCSLSLSPYPPPFITISFTPPLHSDIYCCGEARRGEIIASTWTKFHERHLHEALTIKHGVYRFDNCRNWS